MLCLFIFMLQLFAPWHSIFHRFKWTNSSVKLKFLCIQFCWNCSQTLILSHLQIDSHVLLIMQNILWYVTYKHNLENKRLNRLQYIILESSGTFLLLRFFHDVSILIQRKRFFGWFVGYPLQSFLYHRLILC
jgi:hypothetical protein